MGEPITIWFSWRDKITVTRSANKQWIIDNDIIFSGVTNENIFEIEYFI